MDIVAVARAAHSALHVVALWGAAATILAVSGAWLTGRGDRPAATALVVLSGALVAIVPAAIALSGATGLVLFAGAGGPRDGLHAVYGGVALLALPLTWILGAGPPPDLGDPATGHDQATSIALSGSRAMWLLGGAVITIGALLRLADTA